MLAVARQKINCEKNMKNHQVKILLLSFQGNIQRIVLSLENFWLSGIARKPASRAGIGLNVLIPTGQKKSYKPMNSTPIECCMQLASVLFTPVMLTTKTGHF